MKLQKNRKSNGNTVMMTEIVCEIEPMISDAVQTMLYNIIVNENHRA